MSESKTRAECDYSKFDRMSTEELNEILRQDSLQMSADESDIDAILYITEVITRREKEKLESEFNVEAAWKSFCDNYMPKDDDPESDAEFEEDDCLDDGMKVIPFNDMETQRPKKRRVYKPMIGVAAAIIALLLAGTITAGAFGFNVWDVVAQWTQDTFGFTSNESAADAWSDTFSDYDITTQLVPKWVPERYGLPTIEITETPRKFVFYGYYSAETGEILTVTISKLFEPGSKVYEKDNDDVIVYTVGETEHYIMNNMSEIRAVWVTGNFECSIFGDVDIDEMQRMIDSIY